MAATQQRQERETTAPAMSGRAALHADRTIALALPAGVLLIWATALIIGGGRMPAGVGAPSAEAVTTAVLALLLAGVVAGFILRGGVAARAGERRRGRVRADAAELRRQRTRLVAAWALMEGPALLAGVVYLVYGAREVLLYAAPVYLVGVALTFPRADWYIAEEEGASSV